MKTAEEILESHLTSMLSRTEESYVTIDEMKQVPEWKACVIAIEQAQKEAYDQALDDKLDANKIHIMLSGIKIDNDNLDYIKLTGEICGNLRCDLVEAIKNLKKL